MKRSNIVFISALLATLYLIMVSIYFGIEISNSNAFGAYVIQLIIAFVFGPHLVVTLIGMILNWVAYYKNDVNLMLASAILYIVSTVLSFFLTLLFPVAIVFCIALIALGFVSHSKLKKLAFNIA